MLVRLMAVFQLIRVHNALSAFLVVLLGAHLSGRLASGPLLSHALAGSTVAFLVAAGTHALNDCHDIEIDRINKPGRPLPAGEINSSTAKVLGWLFFGAALTLAATLGKLAFSLALILTVVAYLYTAFLKRTLVANPMVGLLCAAGVFYGGAIMGAPDTAILPGAVVFFFITSREILKTVEDYAGDAHARVRSLATVFGRTRALRYYIYVSLLTIVVTFIPFLTGEFGLPYMVTILLGVDGVACVALLIIMWRPAADSIRQALRLTKASFFFGLLAMFLP